jgi:hypothetical protein
MTKNLPAIRYELFIKAFEKRVTAVQREIEQLRGMEQLYNIVKDAMEAVRLPNEQRLNLHTYNLFAGFRATPTDRLSTFDPVVKAIGDRLRAAGLHDGEPSVSMGGSACDVDYKWRMASRGIWLTIDVPDKGMADLAVEVETRTTQEQHYTIRHIEPRSHPAPARFERFQSDNLGVIEATLDAVEREEVPF